MKRITGSLNEKNGQWYAILNLPTIEGKRRQKWCNLDLPVKRNNKREAESRLAALLEKYNKDDSFLMSLKSPAEQKKYQVATQPFFLYISDFLESYKGNLSPLTYNGYKRVIDSGIIPYFRELGVSVKEVDGDHLNDYYNSLREQGASGRTIQRHHSLLHLAFKHAVKRRIIPGNPCDQADRPKATQFIASHYNAEEVKKLIDCLDEDPLRIVVILTAYYGLRRSEVLGIKWSAIDWSENKIYIRHKIIENAMNNNEIEGYDVMKTKSSYRTLPLIPIIREELEKEKARQEEMQKLLKGSYNKKYLDYVCVDALGEIIAPTYVTEHFRIILKRNNLKLIRFHDLRHSCASILLANKIPMKMIQDWLGHSDMGTTANIYSHLESESKIESATAIASALSNLV